MTKNELRNFRIRRPTEYRAFMLEPCQCSHSRKRHSIEWASCVVSGCACEKFEGLNSEDAAPIAHEIMKVKHAVAHGNGTRELIHLKTGLDYDVIGDALAELVGSKEVRLNERKVFIAA